MKPSSSTPEAGLFDEVFARGPVREAVADPAWLRALLDVEVALAAAQADIGSISPDAARAIAGVAATHEFDIAALGRAAAGPGNPVLPLVEELRAAVPDEHAASVHKGATSQDILDTAAMLVAHRALAPLLADVGGAADVAAVLARRYRDAPVMGRTLLQHAEPTTIGLTAAGWCAGLDATGQRLAEVRGRRLAVQVGGAAGTLAGYGPRAAELPSRLAGRLGLAAPVLPWHTERARIGELAAALGTAAGSIGKVARDVTLLAQTEVAEVAEGSPGRSSAMPHKRNPTAAVCAVACAAQAPGLVATVLGAMIQEHQRAAGAWHAEWKPVRDLLGTVGSAASWLHTCLRELRIDATVAAGRVGGDPADHLLAAAALVDRALDARDAR